MKKIRFIAMLVLAVSLLLSVGSAGAAAADVTASPTSSEVYINGTAVTFEAYTIDGHNYFKLRDLAMALNGSFKRFSVEWDGAANAIRLTSNKQYIVIGGELTESGADRVSAVASSSEVYLDGKLLFAGAYTITPEGEANGNNYFMLRDIAAAMNFSVLYDEDADAIRVDTQQEYYMPAIQEVLPDSTYVPATDPPAPDEPTPAMVVYNNPGVGYLSVTQLSYMYYKIIAEGFEAENGLTELQSVAGIFVSTPEDVIAAVMSSKTNGMQTLKFEDKTIMCMYVGSRITVTISW